MRWSLKVFPVVIMGGLVDCGAVVGGLIVGVVEAWAGYSIRWSRGTKDFARMF